MKMMNMNTKHMMTNEDKHNTNTRMLMTYTHNSMRTKT